MAHAPNNPSHSQLPKSSPSRKHAIVTRPASRHTLSLSYPGIQSAPYQPLVIKKPNYSPFSPIRTPYTQWVSNRDNR